MKKKLVFGAILLLVAAFVSGQQQDQFTPKQSVLIVEPQKPSPAVVRSAELFRVTYKVSYLDLSERGEEVIIFEERMLPENISVAPFMAEDLVISREFANGDELTKYFTYSFRLANPEKGEYILPNFGFYWAIRESGQADEGLNVQTFIPPEEMAVHINYVSSVTPEDPFLDIRDTFDMGDQGVRSSMLYWLGWLVYVFIFFCWALGVLFLVRSNRRKVEFSPSKAGMRATKRDVFVKRDSRFYASREIKKMIKIMKANRSLSLSAAIDIRRNLVVAMKELFRAEFDEVDVGDTPKDILNIVRNTSRLGNNGYVALASAMVQIQRELESYYGEPTYGIDVSSEGEMIEKALKQTSIWSRWRLLFSRNYWRAIRLKKRDGR